MTKLIPRYQTPFSSLNTISYFNSDGTPVWQSKKKQKKAKAGDFVTESLKNEVEKSSENTAGLFTTDMNTGGHATKHVDPYDNMTDIQRMLYEAKQHPTSEIVSYVGRDGQVHSAPTANGALDPEDPIASLYLADKVATPVLKLAGKGMLYGLGRWGEGKVLNWARARLISNAMNEAELNGYKLTTPEFTVLGYTANEPTTGNSANMDRVNNFILNDILPRLKAQGHDISKTHISQVRRMDPSSDYLDAMMVSSGAGAWYTPYFDDVTVRGNPANADFGLLVHEIGGHGIRYNLGKPSIVSRDRFNTATKNAGFKLGEFPNVASIGRDEVFNPEEISLLQEAYPQIQRASAAKGHELHEQGAVNTLFRAKLSLRNGYVTGRNLDNVIKNTSPGEILQMEIEQPYTYSIIDDIAEITGKDADDIRWMSKEELTQLAELYPKLKKMTDNVKKTMTKVGVTTGAIWGLNRNE